LSFSSNSLSPFLYSFTIFNTTTNDVGNVLPHGAPTESDWWEKDDSEATGTPHEEEQEEEASHNVNVDAVKECPSILGDRDGDGEEDDLSSLDDDHDSPKQQQQVLLVGRPAPASKTSRPLQQFRNCGLETWLQCRHAWRAPQSVMTDEEDDDDQVDECHHNNTNKNNLPTAASHGHAALVDVHAAKRTMRNGSDEVLSPSMKRTYMNRQRFLKRKLVRVLGDGSRHCALPQRVSLGTVIDAYSVVWDLHSKADMYSE
jgi:hypothetical protein